MYTLRLNTAAGDCLTVCGRNFGRERDEASLEEILHNFNDFSRSFLKSIMDNFGKHESYETKLSICLDDKPVCIMVMHKMRKMKNKKFVCSLVKLAGTHSDSKSRNLNDALHMFWHFSNYAISDYAEKYDRLPDDATAELLILKTKTNEKLLSFIFNC